MAETRSVQKGAPVIIYASYRKDFKAEFVKEGIRLTVKQNKYCKNETEPSQICIFLRLVAL